MNPEAAGPASPAAAPGSRRDPRWPVAGVIFLLALVLHVWVGSLGWGSTSLVHNGFREAQTAISVLFIQRENNFSLAYPTPVLGPPWSIPMEFPLYQWTVVWVGNLTGLDLLSAGRLVGLICFYLTLPAFYLLGRRWHLEPWRCLVLLAAVLTCPLYLFYARAFLIETMALMFSAWFLYAYVRLGETGRWGWAVGAGVLGVGAALVKVTTLLFFLMPAAVWTGWWCWQAWRRSEARPGREWIRRLAALFLAAGVPVLGALVWVHYADAVKARSFAADFLLSANLRDFNYGIGRRFTWDTWSQHFHIWFTELGPWPLWVVWGALAVGLARRWWGHLALLFAFFMAVQVIFPLLYAFHAYYYVANAWTLMAMVGLVAVAVLDSPGLPRPGAWLLVTMLLGVQAAHGLHRHGERLREMVPGDEQFHRALEAATQADEILVVAGDDWSSIIPYNTGRRALMLRTGVEDKTDYLEQVFAELQGHPVGALILRDWTRTNMALVGLARDRLGIHTHPAFLWRDTTVYLPRTRRDAFVGALLESQDWPEVEVHGWQDDLMGREVEFTRIPPRYRERLFGNIQPKPWKYYKTHALSRYDTGEGFHFDAGPLTRLWFRLPAGEHEFTAVVEVLPAAYGDDLPHGDKTDGVGLRLTEEREGRGGGELYYFHLNPRDRHDQRGPMTLRHTFTLEVEGDVVFTVDEGPHNSGARDWAVLSFLRITSP